MKLEDHCCGCLGVKGEWRLGLLSSEMLLFGLVVGLLYTSSVDLASQLCVELFVSEYRG